MRVQTKGISCGVRSINHGHLIRVYFDIKKTPNTENFKACTILHPPQSLKASLKYLTSPIIKVRHSKTVSRQSIPNCICGNTFEQSGEFWKTCILEFSDIQRSKELSAQRVNFSIFIYLKSKPK